MEPHALDPSTRNTLIGSEGPERLEGRTIRLTLACRCCGYDLRGLSASGVCPECGEQASASLEAAIDPTMHRLPSLLNPAGVGAALVTLGGLLLVGAVALATHVIVRIPSVMDPLSSALPGVARLVFGSTIVVGVLCGLLVWLPAMMLWPSPGTVDPRQGRRGLGLLCLGAAVWIVGLVLIWRQPLVTSKVTGVSLLDLIPLVGAMLSLLGLRRILIEVGTRSRRFRTDRVRRQRIFDLVMGVGFIAVGIVISLIGHIGLRGPTPWWQLGRFTVLGEVTSGLTFIGLAMTLVATVLLLVGLIYLSVNLAWVRRAIQSPPPRLREYLSS